MMWKVGLKEACSIGKAQEKCFENKRFNKQFLRMRVVKFTTEK